MQLLKNYVILILHALLNKVIVQSSISVSAPAEHWWFALDHFQPLYNDLPRNIPLPIRGRIAQVPIFVIAVSPAAYAVECSANSEAESSTSLGG